MLINDYDHILFIKAHATEPGKAYKHLGMTGLFMRCEEYISIETPFIDLHTGAMHDIPNDTMLMCMHVEISARPDGTPYPTAGRAGPITAEPELVATYLLGWSGGKIQAIKQVRALTGYGLKDAKAIVDRSTKVPGGVELCLYSKWAKWASADLDLSSLKVEHRS